MIQKEVFLRPDDSHQLRKHCTEPKWYISP